MMSIFCAIRRIHKRLSIWMARQHEPDVRTSLWKQKRRKPPVFAIEIRALVACFSGPVQLQSLSYLCTPLSLSISILHRSTVLAHPLFFPCPQAIAVTSANHGPSLIN
jgi:hypothetical protein